MTPLAPGGVQRAAGAATGSLAVMAAGSLRRAMTALVAAFELATPGQRVKLAFGASGLLLERIRYGERADVFASANLEHPQSLVADGDARDLRSFARNELCALVAPGLAITSDALVETMLHPGIRVGTSTPKADPSGDYAWMLFERIEQEGHAGAFATLSAKALQLTGGPDSALPPADRNVYAMLLAEGQADIFITYCTNARLALAEAPGLTQVPLPEGAQGQRQLRPGGRTRRPRGGRRLRRLHARRRRAGPAGRTRLLAAMTSGLRAWLTAFLLTAGAVTAPVRAADALGVRIDGDVRQTLSLGAAQLRSFDAAAQRSYKLTREANGQQRETTLRGVALRALLERAALAERDRLDWRKTVVVVSARDGYRVVFSWPELFNMEAGSAVMVAYERDGQALADSEGPLTLEAPGDTRTGPRHVRWLERIEVRILRD
ncbi:MAG: substrate-binding domain-containing protein [Pseudomonadota bacterium]